MDMQELLVKLAEQQERTNELLGNLIAILARERAASSTMAERLVAISDGLNNGASRSSEIALTLLRIAQAEASEVGSG